MKKILALTAVALAFAVSPAMADNHGDKAKMFEKHDTNGDGVISKSEFLSHAEERFSNMDTDGNGEISKDEVQAKRAEMKEKRKDRMKEMREKRQERRDSAGE